MLSVVALVAALAAAGTAAAEPLAAKRPGLQERRAGGHADRQRLRAPRRSHRRDSDRDGLSNWTEIHRTRTNPRKADTDGDGLSDWTEVRLTKTDPRKADSDGDGASDGEEIVAGSDPSDPTSLPGLPAPGSQPPPLPPPPPEPETEPQPPPHEEPGEEESEPPPAEATKAVWRAPDGAEAGVPVTLDGTASSGAAPLACTWSFENQSGSTVWQTKSGCEIDFTFESTGTKYVKLIVEGAKGGSDSDKQSFDVGEGPETEPPPEEETEEEEPEEPPHEEEEEEEAPEPPPSGGCVSGATNATSASAVTSAVSAGRSVCVTAAVGNVNFNSMGDRSGVVVSTEAGSMGEIDISATTGLTIRSARFRSVELRGAHRTTIEDSTIGGTQSNRVEDELIFMPDESNNVVIRNNDIGWTKADNSGNTGYGCRCYGATNNLQFVGNRVHDIAADGFQGTNGSNVLIDRNEIGPVGANPDSSEHSDNIQIVSNGPNLRITNNWIHEQGYYEGNITGNSGSTYIHGGTSNSVLYENNLVETSQGRTEVCGLGTGGTSRSNITIRRNTWVEGGLAYSSFPGFEWDCDSGSGNAVERNIAVDPDGGFAQDGSSSAATFAGNLWGKPSLVTLDASGNCTSANCNPAGQEPIGYRKPGGVAW